MSAPFFIKRPQALFAYACWWLAWTGLQAFTTYQFIPDLSLSVADAALTNILIALAGFSTILLFNFYEPGSYNRLFRLAVAVGISVGVVYIFDYVMSLYTGDNDAYTLFLEKSFYIRIDYVLLSIAAITILSWFWNLLENQKKTKELQSEAERLLRDAELTKLRLQLQPHFLFNSLNSINALVGSSPQEARKMVQQLADFLRGTLKKDDQQIVALSEEMEHLQLYLDIEKVRFGHRLQIAVSITEESKNKTLPILLLQPLVENAIKFGLYDTIDELVISIDIKTVNNTLQIEIKNPFDASTSKSKPGTGFGLSAVEKRLFLLFGRNDLLKIETFNNNFLTRLIIPQQQPVSLVAQ